MKNAYHLGFVAFLLITSVAESQEGYLLFRGNAQRTGEAAKAPAWEKRVAWQRPLLKDKLDGFPEADPDDAAESLIAELRKDVDPAILPGSFPIIVNDVCIYRSYRDVRSALLQPTEFKTADKEIIRVRAGEIMWKSVTQNRSLSAMLEKAQSKPAVARTVAALKAQKQDHFLWANPAIGSLSSDGKTVICVNDVCFPEIDLGKKVPLANTIPIELNVMKMMISQNPYHAYHFGNGKLIWDLNSEYQDDKRFKESHFLGPPLPYEGKLYSLNERDGELRLLVIDGTKLKDQMPEVAPPLVLTKIPEAERILRSPLRRTQALHIAAVKDLLVCPTHAGIVIGVDRAKMAILWTYRYRDEKVAPPLLPHWQAACPMIHKDRIVLAAADAKEIHCLDLDGNKKWTAADANGLYVATVHNDLVLVVGKGSCRALKLADGTEKWKLEMGVPAGVGVKDGSLYYLPLRKDAVNNAPTIWAIDLDKCEKARRVNVPHPDALGNLALHRGMVVSQSATHIAAFPVSIK